MRALLAAATITLALGPWASFAGMGGFGHEAHASCHGSSCETDAAPSPLAACVDHCLAAGAVRPEASTPVAAPAALLALIVVLAGLRRIETFPKKGQPLAVMRAVVLGSHAVTVMRN